jgi:hypothetical protein
MNVSVFKGVLILISKENAIFIDEITDLGCPYGTLQVVDHAVK